MEEQERVKRITAINQQLDALKEQVNKAHAEVKTHAEKRDKLNEQFRKIRQETQELADERNRLNEKVRTLKLQRDEARANIQEKIEEIKALRKKIAELKKKTPKRSYQELQEEFEKIEWKIQTTSMDLPEEKKLIEGVKQLEIQINVYKKIMQHNQKINELQKELDSLETEKNSAHKELTETAQKSQEIHEKIVSKINESKNIKNSADEAHSAYLKAKEQTRPLNDKIKELTERRTQLQKTLREESEEKKKIAESNLREKLESQAREKLQRGEKLSWNEFQLLAGDEPETQD
ncbi:MAG: hypothetical protein NWE94_10055 [Candidatus Bathyarchaeota archaeon]|nr:hypothetical protein [Candidatus Bathyarchaeota archaeon]